MSVIGWLMLSLLLLGTSVEAAVTGYRQEKNSPVPMHFTSDTVPDCATDTSLLFWAGTDGVLTLGQLCTPSIQARTIAQLPASAENGETIIVTDALNGDDCTQGGGAIQIACTWNATTGSWGPALRMSLQAAQELGPVGGWTNVLSARPLTYQFERDTLGETSMRVLQYGESGSHVTECKVGALPGVDCHPAPIFIAKDRAFDLLYASGTFPTETVLEGGTLVNTAGVLSGTGVFARSHCEKMLNVTTTDDNFLVRSFDTDITVKQVWCSYEGSAPSTMATFSLVGMTHTTPVCTGPTATAVPQTITAGGAVPAFKPILSSVGVVSPSGSQEYMLCISY